MAIGILMVARRLTDEAAFERLRQVSDQRDVELLPVAEDAIHRGRWTSGSAVRRGRRPWTPRRGSPAAGRAP
ncbi:ANTAR domain-containing protein [Geodermatophilus sp. URMC 60]